jgi:tetratricopeptide (TPR) repeat protein
VKARRADWPGLAGCAVLAAGTLAIYSRTLAVPLLLDDLTPITDNPSIRRLWPVWPALFPPADSGVGGRPVVNLSYALNYAAGGTAVPGYHLANLLIHVLAGWILFLLVRRTLRLPTLSARFAAAANPLALAIAAIWAWHPLQTESVTYISERAESLMGLFYLLTLYSASRGMNVDAAACRVPPETRRNAASTVKTSAWNWIAVFFCLIGMATKEVMVTAPLAVLLYDRTFISGTFAAAWRRHRGLYLALAATWIPLGCLMTGLRHRSVGFGQGVAWWAYGLTSCRAVVKYLALALWPSPLVFDYGDRLYPLSAVWPYAIVLAALLAAAIAALRRAPAAGFAAGWFFLILAPTSSIVPIVGQTMAENRMYLPLAGVVALAVLGAFAAVGRWTLPVFAAAAVALGFTSFQRNRDYQTEEAIWSDTVAKSPGNSRAHNNLGNVWLKAPGRLTDAISEYEEAIRLKPEYPEAHNNLGNALITLPGRRDEAIAQYQEAMRLKPDYAEAHDNLGNAWMKLPGRLDDAIGQIEEAIRLKPDDPEAHNNLGDAFMATPDRAADAIAEYEEALRLRPDFAEAHYNLANAWSKTPGRTPDAIAQYGEALRLRPDFVDAHYNLGNAWLRTPGGMSAAAAQFEEALRLNPDYAEAHFNLGVALLNLPARRAEARAQFEAFLQLRPGNETARKILAQLPVTQR